jgi:hypothetical protein
LAQSPAFTPITGSPFAAGIDPHSVAFSPGGGLLATANIGGNNVSVFSVDASTELVLRVRSHGHWRQAAVATLHGHPGANRFRLAGRWHGQMLPARRVQILVKLHTHGRWATHKTLTLTVHSPYTTRILHHH